MPAFATTAYTPPHQTVSLPSTLTVLSRQQEPITREMQTQFEKAIERDTALLAHDVAAQDRQAHAEAVLQAEHSTQQVQETTGLYTAAQEEYQAARVSPWSLFNTLLFGSATCAVVLCEYYITNTTLPSALGVSSTSLLGLAVSLGPTVAFLFLEKPFEHLQQSHWHKAYHTFLWLIFTATLVMVFALTEARHEVLRVMAAIATEQAAITFNDAILNHAILAVSLLLALDGAFFLLWARQSGRPWLQHRRARGHLRRLQQRFQTLHKHHMQRMAEVTVCQARLDDNRAQLLAEHYAQQCRAALAKLPVEGLTSARQVEDTLGLRFPAAMSMN